MTTKQIEKLTSYAASLDVSHPRIEIRNEVVSLYATAGSYDGRTNERHVAFLGLVKSGVRRLMGEIRNITRKMGE